MIPLWITATPPPQSTCGWAFRSVGAPCVAQRVWPMAVVPAIEEVSRSAESSSASFPARFTTRRPSFRTATPDESYPRYPRRRSPSTTMGRASSDPTYPTMPHMDPP